jgi:hypothetical protein
MDYAFRYLKMGEKNEKMVEMGVMGMEAVRR